MRKRNQISAWVVVMAIAIGAAALPGCGGGSSGGGGGGNIGAFLTLLGAPGFGNTLGGNVTVAPYPTLPVTGVPVPSAVANSFGGPAYSVAPPVFPVGAQNSTDYIELSFNVPLQAASITSDPPSGTDGIVIQDEFGNAVDFFLDETGAIDPANAFPAPDTAPATLRLYFQQSPTLAAGSYSLAITNNLKSFSGGNFCTTNPGSSCTNSILPRFPFSMDTDTLDISMDAVNPSLPLQGDPAAPINSEIILNFADAVDFEELVGVSNVTTLDPYVSMPMGFANVECNGTVLVQFFAFSLLTGLPPGNLFIGYTPPLDLSTTPPIPESIPANLGCIVYMPEPQLNPTQVRIRFVDVSALVGGDAPTAQVYQTYASGNFNIASSDPAQSGAPLVLPPVLPVPGSLPPSPLGAQTASCEIAVYSEYLGLGGPMDDYSSPPLPVVPAMGNTCFMATQNPGPGATGQMPIGPGCTDRSGNKMQSTFYLTFTWGEGPVLAQNPVPPDAIIVGTQSGDVGLSVVNTADVTTSVGPPPMCPNTPNYQVPVTYGATVDGQLSVPPVKLNNPAILGFPQDLEIGAFIAGNNISNPPRGMLGTAGIPDQQDGTGPTGLLGVLQGACGGAPAQPLGNYLYVVDGDAGSVKVFSSYDFSLLTTLVGIPDPAGLGIAPNLSSLYVSNFGQGTVQRIDSNPVSPSFHTVLGTIVVGNGPTAVSAQPGAEDIFVCNTPENSYSIIDTGTQVERIKLQAGLGPRAVFATNRMLGMGLTNAYQAFILNEFSDNVTVYESDSPAVPENGVDGRQVAQVGGFFSPTRGSWNWRTYIGFTSEPGCYVVNVQGTTVDEFTMFNFTLSPQPGFPGPAGRRDFHVLKAYNSGALGLGSLSSPSDATLDSHSGLYNINVAGVTNNKAACDPAVGGGVPSVVLISYPGAGLVAGFAANSPALITTVSVPGCDILQSYYDQ